MVRPLLLVRLAALAAAPLLLAPAPTHAGPGPDCEPSPEVARLLVLSRESGEPCDLACFDRRVAALEAALSEHPRDVHLHRALLDLWQYAQAVPAARREARDAVQGRYRDLAAGHPGDALYQYLAGRTIRGREGSRPFYEAAVAADAGFPWGHAGLVQVHASPRGDGDPERAAAHLRRFLELCPARLDAVARYERWVKDDALWREAALRAREALAEVDLERAYPRYPAVWQTLYAATPLEGHPGLAPRVREDLARIEAPGPSSPLAAEEGWWRARESARELLGEEAARAALEAERLARFPCTATSQYTRFRRWADEHPYPPRTAPEDERTAHARQALARAEAWLETCPDAELFLNQWIGTAAGLDDLPAARAVEMGERYLAATEGLADAGVPAPATLVAGLYLEHGVELERVADLARRGLEQTLARQGEMLAEPDLDDDLRAMIKRNLVYHRMETLDLVAGAALARERPEEAREALAELFALADAARRPAAEADEDAEAEADEDAEADPGDVEIVRMVQHTYWTRRAELAALDGAELDAAVFWGRAAALSKDGSEDGESRAAREAWEAAGGGAEAWQALLEAGGAPAAEAAETSTWKERALGLPEFEVADLAGATWRLASFEGKAVFANVWATWCGPCRLELPLVETLHERLAGRDDVLLVTLNVDSNPGAAKRYMEQHGYTFPVLLAQDLVDRLAPATGIPLTWIVDPESVIRREKLGFGNEGEEWVDEVVALLEAEAGGGG